MRRSTCFPHRGRRGSVLLLSIIFLVIFSALAVAMASMSGSNVQVAENHRKLDMTRACAESGLDVMRYWMAKVGMSGSTPDDQRFSELFSKLDLALADVNNISLIHEDGSNTITIADVPLNSSGNESFSALLTKIDVNNTCLDVTGHYGSISKTIRTSYKFKKRADTVFDFGVASKGPVSLSGNVDLEGVNIDVESNAYIETGELLALEIIGNSQIAGQVKIVNPRAYVYLQGGQAGIGGVTGEAATHPPYTTIGVPPTDFPEMTPQRFIDYAEAHGTVVTAEQANQSHMTFTNPIIRANTNPSFANGNALRGVVFVETPNTVIFSGHVTITGIIVTNGNAEADPGTNVLDFRGNVTGYSVETLPTSEFGTWLPEQTGTFIMAPGFRATFGGSFEAESGAIAANGISLHGSAGGTINGSIINYAEDQMTLSGNSDLRFNRTGLDDKVPAGFVPELILEYQPATYTEVAI
jgi:Tfp pilus assembly protein PilX